MPAQPGSYMPDGMLFVMFEACLSLPQNRREALLLADQFDALARALREWSVDAWRTVSEKPVADDSGLFERLVARTAPAAVKPSQRAMALRSAEGVADVLHVLWPEPIASPTPTQQRDQELAGAVS
jgi:dsDNA-binding SOS-regulon protein